MFWTPFFGFRKVDSLCPSGKRASLFRVCYSANISIPRMHTHQDFPQPRHHPISPPPPSSSASTTSIPYRGRWNPFRLSTIIDRITKEAVVGLAPGTSRSCRAPCRPLHRLYGPAHLWMQACTTMEVATYTMTRSQCTFPHFYA